MRRNILAYIVAIILIAILISLIMVGLDKAKRATAKVGAQYILVETNLYFEQGNLTADQFIQKVRTIAVNLMPKFEKVTTRFYISEGGTGRAIVIVEIRKCK